MLIALFEMFKQSRRPSTLILATAAAILAVVVADASASWSRAQKGYVRDWATKIAKDKCKAEDFKLESGGGWKCQFVYPPFLWRGWGAGDCRFGTPPLRPNIAKCKPFALLKSRMYLRTPEGMRRLWLHFETWPKGGVTWIKTSSGAIWRTPGPVRWSHFVTGDFT